jgi:3-(3-hydroxy-phenyl)propionate hydroxylase
MLYGDHPAVGRQLPQPMVDGHPLDQLLGRDFALIVDDPTVLAEVGPQWADLATVVAVPAGILPLTLPPGGAVIVRPDRYVAAVAHDAAELAAASTALLTHMNETRGQTPRLILTEGTTP